MRIDWILETPKLCDFMMSVCQKRDTVADSTHHLINIHFVFNESGKSSRQDHTIYIPKHTRSQPGN